VIQLNVAKIKYYQFLFGIGIVGFFVLWLKFIIFNIELQFPYFFISLEFLLFLGFCIGFFLNNIFIWKKSVIYAKDIIYEIILYRKETSLIALSRKLNLSVNIIYEIIMDYIKNNKIIGEIKDNIFFNFSKKIPICPLCNEKIEDPINLLVCPFCRKPFHKNHLLKFMNEVESSCPNCKHSITLKDLYLEEEG